MSPPSDAIMTPPAVTVIGAGIVGCLVAHEIVARCPQAAVTVIDRDTVGGGASRRSAGLQLPRGGTVRVREMSRYSADFYSKLMANQPSLPIYPLPQTTVISAPDRHAESSVAYLPEAAMTPLAALPEPGLRLPAEAGLWRIDGCHQADVYGVCSALACELRGRVSFQEGVRVVGIESSESGVLLRLGTGQRLRTDRVVLAPGPWPHAPAWRELVAPLGIRVKKVVALHVEQLPGEQDRAIVFQDEDAFLIPLRNRGHWLFSYTNQEWDVDPDDLFDGLSADNLEQARTFLRRYSPSLAENCSSGRAFCDAYSTSGEPEIRRLDDAGRLIFAGAANGSGYRLAPAIAAEATDLLQLPSN
jgi:D-arginine dehydrogenase